MRKEQTGYLVVVHQCVWSVSLRFLRLMFYKTSEYWRLSFFKKQKRNAPNSDMVQFSWHVSMFSSRHNNQDFILENFLIFARKTKSSFDSVKSFTAFCSALYECKPFWEIYEIILCKMLYYKTIQDTLTMVKILWFFMERIHFCCFRLHLLNQSWKLFRKLI